MSSGPSWPGFAVSYSSVLMNLKNPEARRAPRRGPTCDGVRFGYGGLAAFYAR